MSNPILPAELLDHIVDLLHDREFTLRNCCLVSKSWISRTRKHLFANILLDAEEDLESWKEMFPDPSTSPACYTKTLAVGCPQLVTTADAETGGWIRGFSCVVGLEVGSQTLDLDESGVSLIPFHGLSPTVKHLRANFHVLPSPRIFNLALSFPLLEDLSVVAYSMSDDDDAGSDRLPPVVQPSNPPAFTGTLNLLLTTGMEHVTPRLLSLPGGIHFWKLTLMWVHEEDPSLTLAVVEKCSHTVETLDITCHLLRSATIDLSKATKLKNLVLRPTSMGVEWITTTFQPTISKHRELRQISICVPYYSSIDIDTVETTAAYGQWLDLDRLLVQFGESHSTSPKAIYITWEGHERDMRGFTDTLLPELTKRGMVDLVE